MSRKGASLVHSLVVGGRKHANGVFTFRRPATQKGATQDEDPRAGTSGFKESTPCMTSYNKGQCSKRLAQAVWARAIARRRLVREVGSEERKEESANQH